MPARTEISMVQPVYKALFFAFLPLALLACGVMSGLDWHKSPVSRDGAPNKVLRDCEIDIPIPRLEPKSRGGNRPTYTVHGKTYRVLDSSDGFVERGVASWYGTAFHGNLTSNGERYDMYAMTAAHKHLPLPTYVEVRNLDNNRRVIVRVNDRGPFIVGRVIDLSYAAATKIGMLDRGTARVEVRAIDPSTFDYAAWSGNEHCRPSAAAPTTVVYPATTSSSVAGSSGSPAQASVKIANSSQITADENTSNERVALGDELPNAVPDLNGGVFLQLATYSQRDIASRELLRLEAELRSEALFYEVGLFPYYPAESSQPWYRLRVGPIESQYRAEQLVSHPAFLRFGKIYPVQD